MGFKLEASATECRAVPAEGLEVREDAAGGVAFVLRAAGGLALATAFGDGASVLGGGTMGVSAGAVVPAIRVDVL